MKKHLLLVILLIAFFGVKAQITITNASFPNIGDTQIVHNNTSGLDVSIVPGNSGANQTWNLSALANQSSDTTLIVSVASTAFASSFPTATAAALQTGGTIGYIKSTTTEVDLIGAATAISLAGVNLPATAAAYSSPNILAKSSITYQSNYNFPTAITKTIAVPNVRVSLSASLTVTVDSGRITQTSTTYRRVDGYGTVTTPKGTFACIREKDSTITNTKIDVNILDTIFSVPVKLWQTAENKQGAISVSYSFKDNNNIVDIATITMDSSSNTVSSAAYRERNIAQPASGIFNLPTPSLFTIYPNPAQSHISALIGGLPDGNYSLVVYNIYGQELLSQKCSVASNAVTAIDLSQLNLSAGNYLMTIANHNGLKLQTQKFEVLK